jgi:hypothetical protein
MPLPTLPPSLLPPSTTAAFYTYKHPRTYSDGYGDNQYERISVISKHAGGEVHGYRKPVDADAWRCDTIHRVWGDEMDAEVSRRIGIAID